MERLTRDLLENNTQTLLNYAFSDHLYTGDEKGRVLLAYAGDSEDMDLCEYVSKLAREKGCNMTPLNVMDGGCVECDCPVGILYVLGVQAAELHARLYAIENILGDTYDLNKLEELWATEATVAGRVVTASDLYDEDGGEITGETACAAEPTWKERFLRTFQKGAEE